MFRRDHRLEFAWPIPVVLCGLVFGSATFAQEPGAESVELSVTDQTTVSGSSSSESSADTQITDRESKENLRKSVMTGLLVLSLICIVFLVLIILVALWARRIRMMTQKPLPDQHVDDPLWYLRKGKPAESSAVADMTDRGLPDDES